MKLINENKSFLVKIWRANIWFEHFEQCLWVHYDGTDPGAELG